MNKPYKTSTVFILIFMFALATTIFASGSNEEGYVQIGSVSDDKKAVIKSQLIVVKQINQIFSEFIGDYETYITHVL